MDEERGVERREVQWIEGEGASNMVEIQVRGVERGKKRDVERRKVEQMDRGWASNVGLTRVCAEERGDGKKRSSVDGGMTRSWGREG